MIILYAIFLGVFTLSPFFFKKDAIHIALVGPMKTNDGEAMVRGVRMYVDQLNQSGGISGREVRLLTFDDRNDTQEAIRAASEIVHGRKALVAIGHYYSTASIAAGKIYKRGRMPIITASAIIKSVTEGNDCFFRIIPDNHFQTSFIANYLLRSLKKTSVIMAYADDAYGRVVAEQFGLAAHKSGIEIKKKWKCCTDENTADRLVAELRNLKTPNAVFMVLYPEDAAKVMASLKASGIPTDTRHTFIGGDPFSNKTFISDLEKYCQKQKKPPGYYSDGIYVILPFIAGLGNEKTHPFEQQFFRKYDMKPSWIEAYHYDAADVAAEAIRQAGIQGGKNIRNDRLKVRKALESFYGSANAVRGVTGDIYFGDQGDANRPLSMGIYKNQKIFPAFSQYNLTGNRTIDKIFEKSLKGDIMMIDGKLMNRARVVYAGIKINGIRNMDMKNLSYSADFYLWFRFKGNFDDTHIEFTDSVNPVRLGPELLIREENTEGLLTRIYHVKADFKMNFDLHNYPFDRQTLNIRFRHLSQTSDKLIYISDTMGVPLTIAEQPEGKNMSDTIGGWFVRKIFFYPDMIRNISTLGQSNLSNSQNMIRYSRFNAVIHLKRKMTFDNFFYVLIMGGILCLTHFIPVVRGFKIRIMLLMLVLTGNIFYHLNVLSSFRVGYLMIIEYAFFIVYALIAISVFVSIAKYRKKRGLFPYSPAHCSRKAASV